MSYDNCMTPTHTVNITKNITEQTINEIAGEEAETFLKNVDAHLLGNYINQSDYPYLPDSGSIGAAIDAVGNGLDEIGNSVNSISSKLIDDASDVKYDSSDFNEGSDEAYLLKDIDNVWAALNRIVTEIVGEQMSISGQNTKIASLESRVKALEGG